MHNETNSMFDLPGHILILTGSPGAWEEYHSAKPCCGIRRGSSAFAFG